MRKVLAASLAALSLGAASPAFAEFGARLGFGPLMIDPDDGDPSGSAFAVGAAYRFDLAVLGLEADLLYVRHTIETEIAGSKFEGNSSAIAIPVIGKFNLPIIPAFLSIDLGLGIEPRFSLGAEFEGEDVDDDNLESMVWYLPVVIGATLDLQLIAANLEIRYERQLTNHAKGAGADDSRQHALMFFAGAFF